MNNRINQPVSNHLLKYHVIFLSVPGHKERRHWSAMGRSCRRGGSAGAAQRPGWGQELSEVGSHGDYRMTRGGWRSEGVFTVSRHSGPLSAVRDTSVFPSAPSPSSLNLS